MKKLLFLLILFICMSQKINKENITYFISLFVYLFSCAYLYLAKPYYGKLVLVTTCGLRQLYFGSYYHIV